MICDPTVIASRVSRIGAALSLHRGETVIDRIKTVLCVGLVVLGLMLTIPWWGLIGWAAIRLAGYL